MVLYASAQNYKQAENRLFLQIKSGRILDILGAFPIKNNYSTRACWLWDDYSQLGATCLVGYLPSHIQRALVE